jgi:hypothetical protein
MSDISNLIRTALTKDATGFKACFSELVSPRMSAAIDVRKKEIAQSIFNKKTA